MAEKNSQSVPIKGKQAREISHSRSRFLGWRVFADAIDIPGQNKSKSSSYFQRDFDFV